MKEKLIKRAIIKTLIYSDIFSFPLKEEEIFKWLIWEEKISPPSIKDFNIVLNSKSFNKKEKYYFASGRDSIVEKRKQRIKFSLEKKDIAGKISNILKKIPTIKLIGISGALAMDNVKKKDDIDLFIISRKNSLWITRLLVTIILEIKKNRRHPDDLDVENKICSNMLLTEDKLMIPENEQNLFSAHEVTQMKPLWQKDYIYNKFLFSNMWITNYLPNSIEKSPKFISEKKSIIINVINYCFFIIDFIVMLPQLLYMKRHITREVIEVGRVKFHPKDICDIILNEYNKRLKKI